MLTEIGNVFVRKTYSFAKKYLWNGLSLRQKMFSQKYKSVWAVTEMPVFRSKYHSLPTFSTELRSYQTKI